MRDIKLVTKISDIQDIENMSKQSSALQEIIKLSQEEYSMGQFKCAKKAFSDIRKNLKP